MNLAIRNIRKNKIDYMIYCGTLILSIAILLIFNSIIFTDVLGKIIDSYDKLNGIFYMAIIIVMLVVSIFVWYANKFFIRKRKKEFGMLALVGMENNKIANMIIREFMIIGIVSVLLGTILGIILLKGFFYSYYIFIGKNIIGHITVINIKTILVTNCIFLFFYYLVTLNSSSIIEKFKLVDLFDDYRKKEEGFKKPLIKGIPAVLIIIIGYLTYPWAFMTLGLSTIITTGIVIKGTYKLFSTKILNNLIKKKEDLQLGDQIQNIAITNILFRFKSNSRMLSTIAILIASNLTVVGICATLYFSGEKGNGIIGEIFFIGISIGIVFTFCTLSMLLFKLIREAFEERERFKILYKIGFSKYEINKIITKELKFYFVSPLKVGVTHALVALSVTIFGLFEKFIFVIGGVICIYLILYSMYFFMTRALYIKIIGEELNK